MRTQLTIATLAAFTQAIQLRLQETNADYHDTTGTDSPHYDDHDEDYYSFHNWVGKYHF